MTTRTPSMVSEVSAIEVASTTLRRPGGDGATARSCSAAVERAVERRDVDRGIARSRRADSASTRRISPWPGRKTRTEPASARSARSDRVGDLPRRCAAVRIAAEIARLDREGAALRFDHRRIAEQPRDAGAVEGRRHDEKAQILAQAGLRVEREGEAEIGVEGALVELVEQDRRRRRRGPDRRGSCGRRRPR